MMQNNGITIINENKLRLLCYTILKSGFSYPTKENYEILKSMSSTIENKESLLAFINNIPPIDELEVVYTTFFDVVYKDKGCHLRESEYLSNKASTARLLLECKGFYKNFGLHLPPNELPDSLYIEFEFMYYLTYLFSEEYSNESSNSQNYTSNIEHLQSILSAQHDFLNRHLYPFLNSIQKCVNKYSELDFYSMLIQFAIDFVDSDIEFVKLHLSDMT